MMIQWFEDKINFSILPTQDNLSRLNRYANTYAENDMPAASLACILCRLVIEIKVKGSSIYGVLSAYTGESTKVYYLPELPLSEYEYKDLTEFLETVKISDDLPLLKSIGHDLCAIFPLAKRLSINPDHLLFVAIMAAELLMSRPDQPDLDIPIKLDMEEVKLRFGLLLDNELPARHG